MYFIYFFLFIIPKWPSSFLCYLCILYLLPLYHVPNCPSSFPCYLCLVYLLLYYSKLPFLLPLLSLLYLLLPLYHSKLLFLFPLSSLLFPIIFPFYLYFATSSSLLFHTALPPSFVISTLSSSSLSSHTALPLSSSRASPLLSSHVLILSS